MCKSLNLHSRCRSSTAKLHELTDWASAEEPCFRFEDEAENTRNLIHHITGRWTLSTSTSTMYILCVTFLNTEVALMLNAKAVLGKNRSLQNGHSLLISWLGEQVCGHRSFLKKNMLRYKMKNNLICMRAAETYRASPSCFK